MTEGEQGNQRHDQGRQARLRGRWLFVSHGFRWLQDSTILRNPATPDFLQPPCANADDFAVAASSFRSLMTALSPTFEVMDCDAGLSLNHRKCCWVQYGNDSCQELLEWVLKNCPEFREMKIVKFAKYVGTMIGAEGYFHRWTAPWEKFNQRTRKINGTSESLVERLVDFKVYALSVLGYLGSISALGRATLMEEVYALQ